MTGTAGGARARRVRVAVLVAALFALMLVPATADAHTLSKSRMNKAIKAASFTFADQIHGSASTDGGVRHVLTYSWGPCTRRSAHRWSCKMGNDGDVIYPDGEPQPFTCSRKANVQFASSRSNKVVVKRVGSATCTR